MKINAFWALLLTGILGSCDSNQISTVNQESGSRRASTNESLTSNSSHSTSTSLSSLTPTNEVLQEASKTDALLMERLLTENAKRSVKKTSKKRTSRKSGSLASAPESRIISIDELMAKTPWVVVGSNTRGTVSKPETYKPQEPPRVVINKAPVPENNPNVLKRNGKDDVFRISEIRPAYPGGDKAMMAYLSKNIKYPQRAKEDGIEGTVYVQFIVEKDGSVSDVNVVRGIDISLDNEAKRVISAMPMWSPGKQNGLDVAVQYTLPVRFELIK